MSKYLARSTFTPQALQALRAEGATSRLTAANALAVSVGGTLECYYFAFGEDDAIVILDLPDDHAALAASLAANESGDVRVTVTKLLTAHDFDEALTRGAEYRPPGSGLENQWGNVGI